MSEQPADLVLRGGTVYTVDAARSWAQAVAVRDGVIVAVGTDQEASALAGPGTRRILSGPEAGFFSKSADVAC